MSEAKGQRHATTMHDIPAYRKTIELVKSSLDSKEKEFFDRNSGKYVGAIGNIVNYAIAGSETLVNKGVKSTIKTVKNDYKKERAQE